MQRAAGHHNGHIGQAQQLLRNDQAVRDHSEIATMPDVFDNRKSRTAAIDEDGFTIVDESRCFLRDAGLLSRLQLPPAYQ